jgi:hypothetical protein
MPNLLYLFVKIFIEMKMCKVHTIKKTGNYVRLFALLITGILIIQSCEDTNDKTNDPRDNITDTWQCKETSEVFKQTTYTVDITKSSSDSTKILIDNFYQIGPGSKVSAKLNGSGLSIASQTLDGFTISGSGTISSNYKTINLTYTVNDGAGIDHVTAVYTKIQ